MRYYLISLNYLGELAMAVSTQHHNSLILRSVAAENLVCATMRIVIASTQHSSVQACAPACNP